MTAPTSRSQAEVGPLAMVPGSAARLGGNLIPARKLVDICKGLPRQCQSTSDHRRLLGEGRAAGRHP